eukprot:767198-Hanusia_phi.AAC.2
MASEKSHPAATDRTFSSLSKGTGRGERSLILKSLHPFPSCPTSLAPADNSLPLPVLSSSTRNSVWNSPQAIWMTLAPSSACTQHGDLTSSRSTSQVRFIASNTSFQFVPSMLLPMSSSMSSSGDLPDPSCLIPRPSCPHLFEPKASTWFGSRRQTKLCRPPA